MGLGPCRGAVLALLQLILIPSRVLGLSQSIEIDQRPDKTFRHGFVGAPAAAGGSEDKQVPLLARSLSGGGACSLYGVKVGVCPRGQAGGVAQVVCPPLRWWCVQGACAVPCLCSRIFKSGSWVFWSLCIFCPEFAPTLHACSYFHSHTVSLYFVAGGEMCAGASTAAKGPRSQPVSFPTERLYTLILKG